MEKTSIRPQWSAFAKGGMVVHDLTKITEDTKIRSISVEEVAVTRVGSVTTWERLKDETTDKSLLYKGVLGTRKSILKSPIK